VREAGAADKLILFLSCFIYSFPAFFALVFTLCAKISAYFRIRDLVFTQKITLCAKNSVISGEQGERGEQVLLTSLSQSLSQSRNSRHIPAQREF